MSCTGTVTDNTAAATAMSWCPAMYQPVVLKPTLNVLWQTPGAQNCYNPTHCIVGTCHLDLGEFAPFVSLWVAGWINMFVSMYKAACVHGYDQGWRDKFLFHGRHRGQIPHRQEGKKKTCHLEYYAGCPSKPIIAWHLHTKGKDPANLWVGTRPSEQMGMEVGSQ